MTLAALKRTIVVGTRVTMTHHGDHGPGDTLRWGNKELSLPRTREVALVQTNGIAFHDPLVDNPSVSPDQRHFSWLYWPKASDVSFNADGSFVVGGLGVGITYRLEP